ncbi:MAG: RNA 2',3'-cyclic phosphodiesterase [Terriglobia bacterium]
MRVFIAIEAPDHVQDALGQAQTYFRDELVARGAGRAEARWAHRGGIHLTLKFLGELPAGQLNRTVSVLEGCGGFERFVVEVKGFGFFPNVRRPEVFWAGIDAPTALADLQHRVDGAMVQLGYALERRRFAPHLTLARFRTPRPQPVLKTLSAQRQDDPLGSFEVSQFHLFESRLLAGSPAEYVKLASFPGL